MRLDFNSTPSSELCVGRHLHCSEAGSLRKLGAGYLRKYVCLGGLKRKTSGTELWTKFYQKGWSLDTFMFIQ